MSSIGILYHVYAHLDWLAKYNGKMEAISVQWEKTMLVGEYLFATKGIVDGSQHWYGKLYPWTLGTNSRIERLIGTLRKAPNKAYQPTYMDNWLKEFE